MAGEGAVPGEMPQIKQVASTVPANGDVNPYGVALVKRTAGKLQRGHFLVSNFNNVKNQQGTGTTIVDVSPSGKVTLFAQLDSAKLPGSCSGGVGLTTALVVLKSGWVIVGSLPTADGTSATAQAGCLIVMDEQGTPVETFSGSGINGPWDMTAFERGSRVALFVSNVLNGTVAAGGKTVNKGTVIRIDLKTSDGAMPKLQATTTVASGLPERTDPNALVIGPTGLGLSSGCKGRGDGCEDDAGTEARRLLYVADTLGNRIAIVRNPLKRSSPDGTAKALTQGGALNGPLGLAVARNGDVVTVNGNDGFAVETSPSGAQVARVLLDNTGGPPPGVGTLFGVAFDRSGQLYFVDDGSNTLNVLSDR
jgi:hypothetical protein